MQAALLTKKIMRISRPQVTSAYVSIRQHTSAYVSIRQHTLAYVSIRQHTSAYVSGWQHAQRSQLRLTATDCNRLSPTAALRHAQAALPALLLLYFCFTTALLLPAPPCGTLEQRSLLYYCFTTALLLLYYCFTTALLLLYSMRAHNAAGGGLLHAQVAKQQ
jgi:hypothetical protein